MHRPSSLLCCWCSLSPVFLLWLMNWISCAIVLESLKNFYKPKLIYSEAKIVYWSFQFDICMVRSDCNIFLHFLEKTSKMIWDGTSLYHLFHLSHLLLYHFMKRDQNLYLLRNCKGKQQLWPAIGHYLGTWQNGSMLAFAFRNFVYFHVLSYTFHLRPVSVSAYY